MLDARDAIKKDLMTLHTAHLNAFNNSYPDLALRTVNNAQNFVRENHESLKKAGADCAELLFTKTNFFKSNLTYYLGEASQMLKVDFQRDPIKSEIFRWLSSSYTTGFNAYFNTVSVIAGLAIAACAVFWPKSETRQIG